MNYADWAFAQIQLYPNRVGPGMLLKHYKAENGEITKAVIDGLGEPISGLIDSGQVVTRWSQEGEKHDSAGLTYYPSDFLPQQSVHSIYERRGPSERVYPDLGAAPALMPSPVTPDAEKMDATPGDKPQELISARVLEVLSANPAGARLKDVHEGLGGVLPSAIRIYPARTHQALLALQKRGLIERTGPKGRPVYRLTEGVQG